MAITNVYVLHGLPLFTLHLAPSFVTLFFSGNRSILLANSHQNSYSQKEQLRQRAHS
jgi:hypothetical protein